MSRRSFANKRLSAYLNSNKTEEQKELNSENLKFQNKEGNVEKLEKKSLIPENVEYESNLFEDLTENLKEKTNVNEFQDTNFGNLFERFGNKIGENRKLLIQQINEMDWNNDIIPKINKLISIGFTDDQIKIMLRKE